MILDMCIIYIKYPNQANNANKKYNQVLTIALKFKKKLSISNNKRNEVIILLKAQVIKLN